MNRFISRLYSILAVFAIAPVMVSCFGNWGAFPNSLQGSGIAKTETREVAAFTRIDNSIAVDIEIITKKAQTLELTGDDNLLQYIKTEVVGGTLVVSTGQQFVDWSSVTPLRLKISMDMLEAVTNSGIGEITASPVESTRLTVLLSGAGNIVMNNVKVNELTTSISGVGRFQTNGTAERATMNLSGAGSVQARSLSTQNARVTVSGVGSAYVAVTQTLDAIVSGAGDIVYFGTPARVNSTVSGVGSVRQGN